MGSHDLSFILGDFRVDDDNKPKEKETWQGTKIVIKLQVRTTRDKIKKRNRLEIVVKSSTLKSPDSARGLGRTLGRTTVGS